MPMNPRLLRPLASGWTPRQLPGLALWLDAADTATVTVDTGVSEWRDKSGRGLHASQATSGSQPSYANTHNGRKVVTFDGTDDHLAGGAPATTLPVFMMGTMFFPSRKNVGVVYQHFTGSTDSVVFYRGHSNTDGFRLANTTNLSSISLPADNEWHLMGALAGTTSANSQLYYNGSVDVTGNAGTATPASGGYYLARWAGAGANPAYTPMRLGEFVGLNRVPTLKERQLIEGYLAWRWGLQGKLPTNHPYAYSFPGFGSQSQPSNAESLDWISRVYANGGTVSTSTANAVDAFCNAIDSAGIRSKFYRLNLFCGNSDSALAAVRTPLYRGPSRTGTQYGNAMDTNTNFVAGDYAETGANGGLKGNATNKHLATGFAPLDASLNGTDSWHHGVYLTQRGSYIFGRLVNRTAIFNDGTDTNSGEETHWNSTTLIHANQQTSLNLASVTTGMALGTTDSSGAAGWYNNVKVATDLAPMTNGLRHAATYYIFARNITTNDAALRTGTIGLFSDDRLGLYSFGLGMDDTQAQAFNAAAEAFQVALGRNA